MRFGTHRWLLVSMILLAVVAGDTAAQSQTAPVRSTAPAPSPQPPALVPSSKPMMVTRNVPGDAKPIVIDADEIFTWNEGDQTLILVRGQVLVQQGVLLLRCQEAAGWIDMPRYRATGVLHMDLYAEGQVRVDVSHKIEDGPKALLDLNTRGELKLASHGAAVARQTRADDPFYRRASGERLANGGRPASPIVPVSLPVPTATPTMLPSAPVPLPKTSMLNLGEGAVRVAAYFDPDRAFPAVLPAPTVGAGDAGPAKAMSFQLPGGPGGVAPDEPFRSGPPVPPPPASGPATGPTPILPARPPVVAAPPKPAAPEPKYNIQPRKGAVGGGYEEQWFRISDTQEAVVVTNGVIITVRYPDGSVIDLEADRLVVFGHGLNGKRMMDGPSQNGSNGDDKKQEVEFYLSGNVEIREQAGTPTPTPTANQKQVQFKSIRADEVYYDIQRKVAIALSATMEIRQPLIADPIIFKADELFRTGETTYEVVRAEIFSSKLPSDPGLKIYLATATIEDKPIRRLTIFGNPMIDRKTGKEIEARQTYLQGHNVFFEYYNIPYFYLPYVAADLRDPLGPVESLSFGYSNIFGFEAGITFNMYELLGIQPYEGTSWKSDVNYLSARGPALSTEFNYTGKDIFDIPAKYTGIVSGYAIYDHGIDNLGGGRVSDFEPTSMRGRAFWKEDTRDLPYGFSVQSQIYYLSDRNFLEQYFKQDFDLGENASSWIKVKQQQDDWNWSAYAEQRIRPWVTETSWLPKLEGNLIGESFFNRLTYTTSVREGRGQLALTTDGPPYVSPATDVEANTNRIDWMQELSMPFQLGPFKIVPYVKGDFADYSKDNYGDEIGRVWGGGGVRASIPFTRLYPDVHSELFNLDGINHKINVGANYFYADTNEPYTRFPQLDRLNDDASDQLVRDIRPQYQYLLPQYALALTTSPLFDPQTVAIRRLLDNRIDSLAAIDVLQLDLEQRWQTKRGYPGAEHIVDVMTLDLQVSAFPDATRDNFGSTFGMYEYDWLWNIGDRTALTASGLYDPTPNGPRIFNFGAHFNRPDRTSFFIGYTEIEPLQSRAVTGSVTYIFSPKYSLIFNTSFDFGQNPSQTNAVVVTRTGTDLQVSFGVTYNSLQSNFGVVFAIVPNLLPANRRSGPIAAGGQGSLLH